MKHFNVVGEYGPVANQYIDRDIVAQNEQNARILFENYVKRRWPYMWDDMGQHNVYVKEMK